MNSDITRSTIPADWKWRKIGCLIHSVSEPVAMRDEDDYRLLSIRRRNEGFFERDTLKGFQILTKSLRRAIPDTFTISRMQIVHGACDLCTKEQSGGFLSSSYSQYASKDNSQLDIAYLNWMAKHPYMYNLFLLASHGVHIEKMTFKESDWLRFSIPLPPLPEQRKIAAILSSVDRCIEKTAAMIAKLQDLKKAMMQELLTKGLPPDVAAKHGIKKSGKFKDSPLGLVPEEWDVVRLGEIAKFSQGLQVDIEKQLSEQRSGYVRFIRIIDYTQGKDAPRYIENPGARYCVSSEDIVMVRYGVPGLVCRGLSGVIANNMFRVIPSFELVSQDFMASQLQHDQIQKVISQGSGSSTMPALNFQLLKKVQIVMPSLQEQEIIATLLKGQEKREVMVQRRQTYLQYLKKALMQDLLTGKVRVKVENAA